MHSKGGLLIFHREVSPSVSNGVPFYFAGRTPSILKAFSLYFISPKRVNLYSTGPKWVHLYFVRGLTSFLKGVPLYCRKNISFVVLAFD